MFRWATTALAPIALQACERAGVDPSEIAAFVAHQANARIIDGIAKRLNLPNAVIAKDIVESGNTSAASVPLALSKLVERREVPSGAPGAAVRLRRRPHLRRAGRPLPVATAVRTPTLTPQPQPREGNLYMSSREEITAGLAEILEEVAGVNPDDVAEEKSFTEDLDVDSLSMVEVVVAAEEKFGVKIPDDEVQNLKTVGDAVSFIVQELLSRQSAVRLTEPS